MAEIRHMTFDYIIFSTRNTGEPIPSALSGRPINIKAESGCSSPQSAKTPSACYYETAILCHGFTLIP